MKLPTFILSLAMLLPTVSLVAQEEAVPVGADDVSTAQSKFSGDKHKF